MKSLSERCYELMRKIPKGKVTTYKSLALALQTKAYRAIGQICGKNPDAPNTPCHRVISSNGTLGGYAFGLDKKKELLKKEGIEIKNNKIDLEKYEYNF